MKEHDVVRLLVADGGIPAGTEGTVVAVWVDDLVVCVEYQINGRGVVADTMAVDLEVVLDSK